MSRLLPVALLAALSVAGCGSSAEQTAPKETLTEQEKQQVKELQEHRQKEWTAPKEAP